MNKVKIIIIGLLLAFVFSRIYSIDPSKELIGDYGDKYEFFSYMYLVNQNIREGKFPLLRTDTLRYPVGFELGHGYDGVMSVFTGALLEFIMPLPLAYNFTMMLILFFNFYLSFIFFKNISGSNLIAFFGGIFYGFSPYAIARINGHANLAFIGGFPVLFLSLYRMHQRIKLNLKFSSTDLILFFSGILLIAFGSLQYLIITFWVFLLFVGTFFLLYFNLALSFSSQILRGIKTSLTGKYLFLFFLSLIFISVTLFFYSGFIKGFLDGSFVYPYKYWKYADCCLPHLSDLFIPNQFAGKIWATINYSPSSIERVITLGLIEWLLVLYAFIYESNQLKRIAWLVFFSIYLISSLGIIPLPFWPEGGRSVVIFSFVSLVLILNSSLFKNRKTLIFLIILLISERLLLVVYKTDTFPEEVGKIISRETSTAVMNIPLSGSHGFRSALSYVYGKKIIDGYFHDTAENEASLSFLSQSLLERYFCNYEKLNPDYLEYKDSDYNKTLDLLKSWNIKTIVIHKNLKYEKFYYEECRNVRYWWFNLNPQSLIMNKDTEGTKLTTLELYQSPVLKAKIYFPKGGSFRLNGIFISNEFFDDVKININNKFLISPTWVEENGGMKTNLQIPIEKLVHPGDEMIIYSDKEYSGKETVYLTLYYSFTADSSVQKPPPIEKIYSSNDYEIYRIN